MTQNATATTITSAHVTAFLNLLLPSIAYLNYTLAPLESWLWDLDLHSADPFAFWLTNLLLYHLTAKHRITSASAAAATSAVSLIALALAFLITSLLPPTLTPTSPRYILLLCAATSGLANSALLHEATLPRTSPLTDARTARLLLLTSVKLFTFLILRFSLAGKFPLQESSTLFHFHVITGLGLHYLLPSHFQVVSARFCLSTWELVLGTGTMLKERERGRRRGPDGREEPVPIWERKEGWVEVQASLAEPVVWWVGSVVMGVCRGKDERSRWLRRMGGLLFEAGLTVIPP